MYIVIRHGQLLIAATHRLPSSSDLQSTTPACASEWSDEGLYASKTEAAGTWAGVQARDGKYATFGPDSPELFLRSYVTFEGLARLQDADLVLGSHPSDISTSDSLLLIHVRGGRIGDVQDLGAYLSHDVEDGSVLVR